MGENDEVWWKTHTHTLKQYKHWIILHASTLTACPCFCSLSFSLSRSFAHLHCFRYQSVAVFVSACVSLQSSLKCYTIAVAVAALRVYEVRLRTQGIKAIKKWLYTWFQTFEVKPNGAPN